MAKFRLSPEQLKQLVQRKATTSKRSSSTNKFGAKAVIYDGIRFPSQKEGNYYLTLKSSKISGKIKSFIMQVPFRLPGGASHRVDFMVINHDNTVEFIEVKGRDLPMGKLKRHQTEELYGIEIKVV